MKNFMDNDFLLSTKTGRTLYHDYAAKMPIVDYHCHINPQEIYEDKIFSSLAEAWLGGDHYKWRAMRANGIDEKFITGCDTSPFEKFEKWAETVPKLIGNPLYHWTHLELQRYFGIFEPLSPATCGSIWEKANESLKKLSVRNMIIMSKVKVICTTDDPADDLVWHKKLRDDAASPCRVLPAFRPDKAVNIDKAGFQEYLIKLGGVCGYAISDLDTLKKARKERLEYFVSLGCPAADLGWDYLVCDWSADANAVLQIALRGEKVTTQEADAYKTGLLCFFAELYRDNKVVMQLHYGATRNNNPRMMQLLGPDTGFDAIRGEAGSGEAIGNLLGLMSHNGDLPKTIIYSLNPTDNIQISAAIGCFQNADYPGKLQHGSAWWFNDTKRGMEEQLSTLADSLVLANFVGMLTDSRSFLSYTRHEYFRRILCAKIGDWVENGEYPNDLDFLGKMVQNISYNNAVNYFGFSGGSHA